uniref:Uncharacterized protein n=1 Tax=Zea mays TaxID=4577 RepID=C4IZJ0_MAIZE|nr:unknown [Zea mays]
MSTGSTRSYSSISTGASVAASSEVLAPLVSGTDSSSSSFSCSDLIFRVGLASPDTFANSASNSFFIVSLIFSNKIDFTGSLPIHRQSSSVKPLEEARTFWSGWSNSSGSIFRIFLGGTTLVPNSLSA